MELHGQDSHYFLPVIKKKIEYLEQEDMYPFEQAIKNGADALLVGHLKIKNVTGRYPASLSKRFLGKYLRKKYHYNGLIITDDLKMKAIQFVFGANRAVKKAFEAGNDIIVFRFQSKKEEQIMERLFNLVKEGKLKESRINRSVRRILKMKAKYNASDETKIKGIEMEEMNQEILEIRKKCNM